jgi:chitinase
MQAYAGAAVMPGRIVAYLPGYTTHRTPAYAISSVPGAALTHLVYAFAGFRQRGAAWVVDYPEADDPTTNLPALASLKRAWPQLRLLISIGGYAHSQQLDPSGRPIFSVIAATPHARQVFVASCLELFFRPALGVHPQAPLFDGIDLDWEFPQPADQHTCTLLVQEFRTQLAALAQQYTGRHFDLSMAIDVLPRNIELASLAATVDWFNVMAYVAHQPNHSPRNQYTDFNSPLYPAPSPPEPPSNRTWAIDNGVQAALSAGVPADRLVLGVNAYARVYGGVANVNHGLYQPYTGPAGHGGVLPYAELVSSYLGHYESHWDSVTRSASLYGPADGVWMSFDSTHSVQEKAAYVNQHALGGLMLWELSADVPSNGQPPKPAARSLLAAMRANLHPSPTC